MVSLRALLLIGMTPLALCACSTMRQAAAQPVETHVGESPFGLYLAGQAAQSNGESAAAAELLNRAAAAARNPEGAGFLAGQAFVAALLAGDVGKAAELAPSGPEVEPAMQHLGELVRGVEAMAQNKTAVARAQLKLAEVDHGAGPAAALLSPFASAQAGDVQASFVQPVIAGDPVAQFFARLDQGKLFERARHYDEAETAFRSLIARGDPGGIASLELGRMLERRGRGAEAVAIYDAALARSKGDDTLLAARANAANKRSPPALPSLRADAAEALMAPASVASSRKDEEAALYDVRLALRLDPTRDEAWLLLGDTLDNLGDKQAARLAYGKPRRGSPQYQAARAKLAWSYQAQGQKEQALVIARQTLAADPKDRSAATNLADLLRSDERYEDSAKVLDAIITAEGGEADWKLLYMRAVDAEQSGRWEAAEADLKRALALQPDEPELLNFLGYSWIDRGERLPEALEMVQKAVNMDPHSGAMLDSLGWGYFRLGDYPKAVEQLEAAAALDPADPDVNDHLGDAYWRVGRKLEARFQWRRVLTLEPPAKLRAQVQTKIDKGLDGPAALSQVAEGQQ